MYFYLTILLVFLQFSCNTPYTTSGSHQDEKKYTIQKYYFPYQKMTKPKVYVYKTKETGKKQYWWMSFDPKKEVFTTKVYDNNLQLIEMTNEQIDTNGAHYLDYLIVNDKDSTIAELVSNQIFQWSMKKNDTISWEIQYESENMEISLKKSRNIFLKDDKFVVFDDIYKQSIKDEEFKFFQQTKYTLDTGITEQIRYYGYNDQFIHYYLDEILSNKAFLKLQD